MANSISQPIEDTLPVDNYIKDKTHSVSSNKNIFPFYIDQPMDNYITEKTNEYCSLFLPWFNIFMTIKTKSYSLTEHQEIRINPFYHKTYFSLRATGHIFEEMNSLSCNIKINPVIDIKISNALIKQKISNCRIHYNDLSCSLGNEHLENTSIFLYDNNIVIYKKDQFGWSPFLTPISTLETRPKTTIFYKDIPKLENKRNIYIYLTINNKKIPFHITSEGLDLKKNYKDININNIPEFILSKKDAIESELDIQCNHDYIKTYDNVCPIYHKHIIKFKIDDCPISFSAIGYIQCSKDDFPLPNSIISYKSFLSSSVIAAFNINKYIDYSRIPQIDIPSDIPCGSMFFLCNEDSIVKYQNLQIFNKSDDSYEKYYSNQYFKWEELISENDFLSKYLDNFLPDQFFLDDLFNTAPSLPFDRMSLYISNEEELPYTYISIKDENLKLYLKDIPINHNHYNMYNDKDQFKIFLNSGQLVDKLLKNDCNKNCNFKYHEYRHEFTRYEVDKGKHYNSYIETSLYIKCRLNHSFLEDDNKNYLLIDSFSNGLSFCVVDKSITQNPPEQVTQCGSIFIVNNIDLVRKQSLEKKQKQSRHSDIKYIPNEEDVDIDLNLLVIANKLMLSQITNMKDIIEASSPLIIKQKKTKIYADNVYIFHKEDLYPLKQRSITFKAELNINGDYLFANKDNSILPKIHEKLQLKTNTNDLYLIKMLNHSKNINNLDSIPLELSAIYENNKNIILGKKFFIERTIYIKDDNIMIFNSQDFSWNSKNELVILSKQHIKTPIYMSILYPHPHIVISINNHIIYAHFSLQNILNNKNTRSPVIKKEEQNPLFLHLVLSEQTIDHLNKSCTIIKYEDGFHYKARNSSSPSYHYIDMNYQFIQYPTTTFKARCYIRCHHITEYQRYSNNNLDLIDPSTFIHNDIEAIFNIEEVFPSSNNKENSLAQLSLSSKYGQILPVEKPCGSIGFSQ